MNRHTSTIFRIGIKDVNHFGAYLVYIYIYIIMCNESDAFWVYPYPVNGSQWTTAL